MAVLAAPAVPLSPALPTAAGPACSLHRSGSLWPLGIEAQEITTAIGQLAEQPETDDHDARSQSLAELEAPFSPRRATRRPSLPRPMPTAG